MQAGHSIDFWHFLRLVFVFFLGGVILSMFALQLSPSFRETTLELVTLRREARQMSEQFKEKERVLQTAEKNLRLCAVRAGDFKEETDAEILKRTEVEAELKKTVASLRDKTKVIERMDLEKTQTDQQIALQTTEIEKLKKDIAKTDMLRSQEKKEYETRTLECSAFQSEAEGSKVKIRELKNEMARLTLEHEQVKKEGSQKEEYCAGLKKQMDERDEATSKLVKKVEKDDLKKLLDPESETGSIDKKVLESLLPPKKPKTDRTTVNATLAPIDAPAPAPPSPAANPNEFVETIP